MTGILARVALALALALPVVAGADPAKFAVNGTTLLYDTGIDEIDEADAATLRSLLRDNRDITLLELNSTGGDVYAAYELARVVIDFGLDTMVTNECSSACVIVFLAGQGRQMQLGASIGFHQSWWSPGSIQRYYESNREYEGWATPFEFASWLYRDTQTEVYNGLSYMVRRGVAPGFAIETLRAEDTDMWYPWRIRLLAAGVLRDRPQDG